MPSERVSDTLEHVQLIRLKPFAANSRTHTVEQVATIAASIKEFGFTNPVLVDESDGIIAGHGRVSAAMMLGLPAVPCIRLRGLTDKQKRAYVIADNKLALNAGWDFATLRDELTELDAGDYDVTLTGFDYDEREQIATWTPDPRRGRKDKRKASAAVPELGAVVEALRVLAEATADATYSTAEQRERHAAAHGVATTILARMAASTNTEKAAA